MEILTGFFNVVKGKLGLTAKKYDLFGHSAGGQILHRFALFYKSEKADRILSSNSGWYTVPDYHSDFPAGLKNAPTSIKQITQSFSTKLAVFLGELDNVSETRGDLVKNEGMNMQGLHRLKRGTFFFDSAKRQADVLQADFVWKKSN